MSKSSSSFSVNFSHIFRRFNRVVYHLAKFDFDQDDCFEWTGSFPCWLNILDYLLSLFVLFLLI